MNKETLLLCLNNASVNSIHALTVLAAHMERAGLSPDDIEVVEQAARDVAHIMRDLCHLIANPDDEAFRPAPPSAEKAGMPSAAIAL